MSELRKNELTGEWVFITEARAGRPTGFAGNGLPVEDSCPFCQNERKLEFYRSQDGRIKVFANKYPVAALENPMGYGSHELVIDTDKHFEQFHNFSITNIARVLSIIKTRINELETHKRIKYIQVFKNNGPSAGASQPHSHWQIIGLPFIPLLQTNIYENSYEYFKQTKKCYICQNIIKNTTCDVCENAYFKAYCNPASKIGYEIQIVPKIHIESFRAIDESILPSLAEVLKKSLTALNSVFANVDYNIGLMDFFVNCDIPHTDSLRESTHFYMQITPRNGQFGGFELSTSCYINNTPPEKAAGILRNI